MKQGDTKVRVLCDSLCTKCLEQANPQGQKVDAGCLGLGEGWGVTARRMGFSWGGCWASVAVGNLQEEQGQQPWGRIQSHCAHAKAESEGEGKRSFGGGEDGNG